MPLQPFARWKIGAALVTPSSNAGSMPALTSICAISRIMPRSPLKPRPAKSPRRAGGAQERPTRPRCAAEAWPGEPRLAALADAAAAEQAAVERAIALVQLARRARRDGA